MQWPGTKNHYFCWLFHERIHKIVQYLSAVHTYEIVAFPLTSLASYISGEVVMLHTADLHCVTSVLLRQWSTVCPRGSSTNGWKPEIQDIVHLQNVEHNNIFNRSWTLGQHYCKNPVSGEIFKWRYLGIKNVFHHYFNQKLILWTSSVTFMWVNINYMGVLDGEHWKHLTEFYGIKKHCFYYSAVK